MNNYNIVYSVLECNPVHNNYNVRPVVLLDVSMKNWNTLLFVLFHW